MDAFLAEIRIFGGNFAPNGWALCNGQLMAISQNTALFSLLGTTYGGDGRSTFALPNLQGIVPIQAGQGPGLSRYDLGETGGLVNETLSLGEMPNHSHQVQCSAVTANVATPSNTTWAPSVGRSGPSLYSSNAPNTTMSAQALSSFGGDLPHNNMSPYLVLNFIIALIGIFPPRP